MSICPRGGSAPGSGLQGSWPGLDPLPGVQPAPAAAYAPPVALHAWVRQVVACLLVFLLSARIPEHLAVLAASLVRPTSVSHGPWVASAMVALDGFGVLCAVYLSHGRLRGVRLLRCYPPQRLIPLSLHFFGLLWGLLVQATLSAGSGP